MGINKEIHKLVGAYDEGSVLVQDKELNCVLKSLHFPYVNKKYGGDMCGIFVICAHFWKEISTVISCFDCTLL